MGSNRGRPTFPRFWERSPDSARSLTSQVGAGSTVGLHRVFPWLHNRQARPSAARRSLMQVRPRALVSWSSGKDSAFALHLVRQSQELEIVGLLTTVSSAFGRVAMHGVRESLLDAQAEALRLQCLKVLIPWPCSNAIYEAQLSKALQQARAERVTHVVFGDLFLADLRAYREAQLAALGLTPVFPLWQRDTSELAHEMIAAGLRATLTCIDPKKLPPSFVGRTFDERLLADLPEGIDPCGENGEFHTFASAGPMFDHPIEVEPGETVARDGFFFADLLPKGAQRSG